MIDDYILTLLYLRQNGQYGILNELDRDILIEVVCDGYKYIDIFV
jgi:hypothetical protein